MYNRGRVTYVHYFICVGGIALILFYLCVGGMALTLFLFYVLGEWLSKCRQSGSFQPF